MQRELRFKDLSLNDLLQAMILAIVTPVLAYFGFRYWSLVLAGLLGALLSTLLALRSAPHPLAWPRFGEIRPVVSFGSDLLVARLAGYVYDNADALIIGRRLGEAPLGNYRIGTTLANLPTDKITSTATQVANPLFATLQHKPEALRRYLCLMTEAVALLTWPAAVGLALVADLLVAVALGPKWLSAVTPLRILSLVAIMRCVTPLISPILVARGRSRFLAATGVVGAVLIPVAFLIGSQWGLNGVAVAWAVYFPLLSLPTLILLTREIGLRWSAYGRALWPAASSSGLMAAAVLGVRELLPPGLPRGLQFGTLIGTGVMVYLGALVLFHRERIRAVRALLPSRGAAS
jgi:O-antigen/teichoic acid export membrane protein